MTSTVRRRTMTAVETVTDIDVVMPEVPRRTKAAIEAVLGALLTVHQPYYEHRGTVIQETVCIDCRQRWPCTSVRIIIGNWTGSAPAERD